MLSSAVAWLLAGAAPLVKLVGGWGIAPPPRPNVRLQSESILKNKFLQFVTF